MDRDHYARLAATKHFRDFLAAGRPTPKHPEKQERRGMTLEELEYAAVCCSNAVRARPHSEL